MSKKFGLGKGLNALIPEDTILSTLDTKLEKTDDDRDKGSISIDINLIKSNEEQPRRSFDDEKILELAESIKSNGIIQPLVLKKVNNEYIIVAGERRWRAARMAELEVVPCNIIEITDTQSAEIALLENLQREDLNFIEEAEAYYNLINDHKFTQEELAKRMGKKQSTIANKLRLLKLSEEVRILCLENNLTERHARALLKLPNEELMMDIVQKVVKLELTVKKTEKLINDTIESLKAEQEQEKKQNIKFSMSMKLYVNTLKQAYDAIINTGIDAKYNEIDKGDYLEVVVKIPKK